MLFFKRHPIIIASLTGLNYVVIGICYKYHVLTGLYNETINWFLFLP